MIYVKCNHCGHDDTRLVQQVDDTYRVVQCRSCGLVYTNPIPDLHSLCDHYGENYYRDWIEKQSRARERMWRKRIREVMRHKQGGRLLDVGCGLETFLMLAKGQGFQVQGTEVSSFITSQGREDEPPDIFRGELPEAQFPDKRFDVITLWHSLEHMPDPKRNLMEVHRIMKDDGLLVIAVPNLKNYFTRFFYRLYKRKKFSLFDPGAKELHLFHFTPISLHAMLHSVGFCVEQLRLDLSAVVFQRKIIDWISGLVYAATRANFADGFKIFARKSGHTAQKAQ